MYLISYSLIVNKGKVNIFADMEFDAISNRTIHKYVSVSYSLFYEMR